MVSMDKNSVSYFMILFEWSFLSYFFKENIQAVNNFKERFEQELNKIDVQIEQIKTDYKAMMQENPDIKMRITSLEFKIERVGKNILFFSVFSPIVRKVLSMNDV